jgi:hypothetical protein
MQRVHVLGRDVLASCRPWEGPGSSRELSVCVPYTTSDLTRAALAAVGALTRNLGSHVSLVAVQVVPFPLPLNRPAIAPRLFEQELNAVARDIDVPVDAHVVIARDREMAFDRAIAPGSLVVLATRKRWWPTPQRRLARLLARGGHSVALLEI